MALAAVNLFTGAPVAAVWAGSQVQGAQGGLSMTALLVVIVVLAALCLGLVWALGRLGHAHDALAGRPEARRQTTWLRPFNAPLEKGGGGGLSALDKVLVCAVVAAGLAFEGWFFFLAGSSI
jgi:hypothetical protein